MPEMRLERSPSNTTISGGVSLDPYSADTLSEEYQEVGAGTYNIAAGKYRVVVTNQGLNNITVNARTIEPGNTYEIEARPNPVTQRMDLTPAVEIIVPAGEAASYSVISPSA